MSTPEKVLLEGKGISVVVFSADSNSVVCCNYDGNFVATIDAGTSEVKNRIEVCIISPSPFTPFLLLTNCTYVAVSDHEAH